MVQSSAGCQRWLQDADVLVCRTLPVDGGEGEGAEVEGIAGVVVDLHCICRRPLAGCQHLPCLLAHLHA